MKNVIYVITLLISSLSFGQESIVSIDFEICGNTDTICQLGYYRGKSMLVKDTIQLDLKGSGTYKSDQKLPQGIYFLYLKSGAYFDIVINEDQRFSMSTENDDLIGKMTVKGNDENGVFYDFMEFNKEQSIKMSADRKRYDTLTNANPKDSLERIALRKKMLPTNEAIDAKREEVISTHPDYFIAKIFKSMKPVEIPLFDSISDEKERQRARAYYNQQHYFDNIDLSDDRFIRTHPSVFYEKVEYFKEHLMYPIPDSIIVSIDQLIAKTDGSQEMYKYFVIDFTKAYEKSKIMCMDKVKLHMYNKYFLNDTRTTWLDDPTRKKVEDLVEKMRYSQCGMKAPALVVPDTTGTYISLAQLKNKYVVVYFWSATCGHCKKTTPVLDEVYQRLKTKYDVEIFTIGIDDKSKEKIFKEYLNEHDYDWIIGWGDKNYNDFRTKFNVFSTPTMYLLDADKNIIGKELNPQLLEKIITNLEGDKYIEPEITDEDKEEEKAH